MAFVFRCAAFALLAACSAIADPVAVRHIQGYLHGFIVLKDLNDKVLASGDVTESPVGGDVRCTTELRFRDGSVYEEIALLSQRGAFRLLSYKQVEKGPSFKTAQMLTFDSTGKVTVDYMDKDGKPKIDSAQLEMPVDVANGMIPILLTNIPPEVERTLSMVVATPKPRIVKLKIAPAGEDSYSIGGIAAKANHFVINIDLGAVAGTVAKVAGKQPPPIHMWTAAGKSPVFLKSEGQLFEDGPVWRIELASPVWPKAETKPRL